MTTIRFYTFTIIITTCEIRTITIEARSVTNITIIKRSCTIINSRFKYYTIKSSLKRYIILRTNISTRNTNTISRAIIRVKSSISIGVLIIPYRKNTIFIIITKFSFSIIITSTGIRTTKIS